jgi:hypothetical protein
MKSEFSLSFELDKPGTPAGTGLLKKSENQVKNV